MFSSAVERYKADLRARVEDSATDVFLKMTTEKVDYKRLRINDQYGLAIIHTDGREEEGRSSGAEQVVALALMGALQANAPLRGPIVMDTPFGRLDRRHTANILAALPSMARSGGSVRSGGRGRPRPGARAARYEPQAGVRAGQAHGAPATTIVEAQ